MNNFNFIIGFKSITSPDGRIIPDKKFISYFHLRNAKNAYKTSALGNKKMFPFPVKNDALIFYSNFNEVL